MATRTVRIYKGTEPDTNIIGFSRSATDAPDDDRFAQFMNERDYLTNPTEVVPEGARSCRFVEVRPPLSEEHAKEFGALCVGELIDGYSSGVAVFDNREELPGDGTLGKLIDYDI